MTDTSTQVILEALPLPALIIDEANRISVANGQAKARLGPDIAGQMFVKALRHPEAVQCVERARENGANAAAEISLVQPVRTTYRISAARLGDESEAILFTMQDISLLIEAEQARSDFVANVSHELRSPLATLSGIIETLQTSARDDAKARTRFLEIMRAEAERMSRLIGDLLSLSRIETREYQRPVSPVDIAQLVRRVVETVQWQADKLGKQIVCELDDEIGMIPGAEDELTVVVQNLVLNGLKYGAPESEVSVLVKRHQVLAGVQGPGVTIEVVDRGEGIAREHIPRLTERFYRIDKARSRDLGGTGLGLAIVKHIVKRHRGRLQISSEPGVGSRFTICLPLTLPPG